MGIAVAAVALAIAPILGGGGRRGGVTEIFRLELAEDGNCGGGGGDKLEEISDPEGSEAGPVDRDGAGEITAE